MSARRSSQGMFTLGVLFVTASVLLSALALPLEFNEVPLYQDSVTLAGGTAPQVIDLKPARGGRLGSADLMKASLRADGVFLAQFVDQLGLERWQRNGDVVPLATLTESGTVTLAALDQMYLLVSGAAGRVVQISVSILRGERPYALLAVGGLVLLVLGFILVIKNFGAVFRHLVSRRESPGAVRGARRPGGFFGSR